MARKFLETVGTPAVLRAQEQYYGRARPVVSPADHDPLGPIEAAFVGERDGFYMATVTESGWPYVQHRGGPTGFLRVLDERTIGFADFRGNRQYVSVGNLAADGRVGLIAVDYPRHRRLKILGRARIVTAAQDPALLGRLEVAEYPAAIERGLVVAVEAFDWNCPQHITPRFTPAEIADAVAPLRARIAELEVALAGR